LLLRFTVGATLTYCAAAHLRLAPPLSLIIPQIIGAGAGILLLIGLWTPLSGAAVAGVELWITFAGGGFSWISLLLTAIGASLAMIGPGAWSLDALLFGRKHIEGPAR
jgi:putative oxidoreductase